MPRLAVNKILHNSKKSISDIDSAGPLPVLLSLKADSSQHACLLSPRHGNPEKSGLEIEKLLPSGTRDSVLKLNIQKNAEHSLAKRG